MKDSTISEASEEKGELKINILLSYKMVDAKTTSTRAK